MSDSYYTVSVDEVDNAHRPAEVTNWHYSVHLQTEGSEPQIVNVAGPPLMSSAMARAVARAMTYIADDIEQGRA